MNTYKLKQTDSITAVYALESYIHGDKSVEDVQKFLNEACGVTSYNGKVYSNCNGAIAVVCSTEFDGPVRLELLNPDQILTVVRYKNGGHDILMLPKNRFNNMFEAVI